MDSAESGLGVEAQRAAFEAYWEAWQKVGRFRQGTVRAPIGWEGGWSSKASNGRNIRTRVGRVRTDGFYIDLAISAYTKRFANRPAGAELCRVLQEGDTVVFTRLDRAFRDMGDFEDMRQRWARAGINIIYINPEMDLSTAAGQLQAQMMVAVAQFESAIKSERTQEALLRSWAKGRPSNAHHARVFGWKNTSGVWVPYWEERAVIADVMIPGLQNKAQPKDICVAMEARMALIEGRLPRPYTETVASFKRSDGLKRGLRPIVYSEYTRSNIRAWYARYQKIKIPLSKETK